MAVIGRSEITLYKIKAADYRVFQPQRRHYVNYSRGPMTSLAWGLVGHCTSGRPLNPPLLSVRNVLWLNGAS